MHSHSVFVVRTSYTQLTRPFTTLLALQTTRWLFEWLRLETSNMRCGWAFRNFLERIFAAKVWYTVYKSHWTVWRVSWQGSVKMSKRSSLPQHKLLSKAKSMNAWIGSHAKWEIAECVASRWFSWLRWRNTARTVRIAKAWTIKWQERKTSSEELTVCVSRQTIYIFSHIRLPTNLFCFQPRQQQRKRKTEKCTARVEWTLRFALFSLSLFL